MAKEPEIDEAALQSALQPQLDELQAHINETLQTILTEVRDEMEGQPADEVEPVLRSRVQAALPDLELGDVELWEFAEAIEQRTLRD